MAINADGGGRIQRQTLTPADFQKARETRQARLDTRVAEATQAPGRLTTQEISERQGAYNRTIGDIDRLRGDDKSSKLNCLPPDWRKTFPVPSDWRIQDATRPNLLDNAKARDVKQEYAAANAEANRERTQAVRTSQKLGPGEHTMSNGDKVKVATDPKTGETTVTTTRPDGSSKTVTYNDKNPDQVTVNRKDQFGNEETLEKDGTRITKTDDSRIFGGIMGGLGGKTKTTYDLNKNGEPTRTKEGPGKDDWERTEVNKDGSTNTRKLIYRDEQGNPVYHDDHDGNLLSPHPHWPPERPDWPGRPFPLPRFPWDLDPFRPIPLKLEFGEAQAN